MLLGPSLKLSPEAVAKLPFEFLPDIRLQECPKWVKEQTSWSSESKEKFVRETRFALVANYKSASPQDKTTDELMSRAVIAIWLASPTNIQWRLSVHGKSDGSKMTRNMWNTRPYMRPHRRYQHSPVGAPALDEAKVLLEKFAGMTEGAVWIAIKTLYMALQQEWWEGRFLLFWVALEALFAPDSEVSFRVSLRIARLLRGDSKKAKTLFKRIRGSYSIRSKVAHGQALKSVEGTYSGRVLLHSELLLRASIRKILSSPEALAACQTKRRNEYLDSLCL